MPRITVLSCPVCGGPIQPEGMRCNYCGSIVVIETDFARIDPQSLNSSVLNERIAEFRRTVRRDSNDEAAHYGLGVAYFNLGLIEEASDELTAAARLMPENPHIQTQLGVILSKLAERGQIGALKAALDRSERALLLRPDLLDALLLKAHVLAQQGHWEATLSVLEKAVKLDPEKASPKLVAILLARAKHDMTTGSEFSAMRLWREVADIDEEAVREPVSAFLRAHASMLPGTTGWNSVIDLTGVSFVDQRKPDVRRGFATTGLAVGTSIVFFILTATFAVLAPEKNGKTESGNFAYVMFIVCLFAIFIAPIVVIVLRRRQQRNSSDLSPRKRDRKSQLDEYRQELLDGTTDNVKNLLNLASEVAHMRATYIKRSLVVAPPRSQSR